MIIRTTVPVLTLFLVLSASGQPAVPVTFAPLPTQFPPIGLASTETVQVNVVNTAVAPSTASSTATAPSCSGTISIYNSSGAIIGSTTSFTVGSGQIFSATLPFASIGASGSRAAIRVAISLPVTSTASLEPPPACTLASSLEILDTATGVIHAFVPGVTSQAVVGFIHPTPLAPVP